MKNHRRQKTTIVRKNHKLRTGYDIKKPIKTKSHLKMLLADQITRELNIDF